MDSSLEDIINKQRKQANLSIAPEQLKSDLLKEKEAMMQTNEYWMREIKSSAEGYHKGLEYLQENPTLFSDPLLKEEDQEIELTLEDCIIQQSELEIFNDKDKINTAFTTSSLQKLWGKSDKVLLAFYIVAQKLFEDKKMEDSMEIFTFLTLLNQNIPSFWIGRGSANESLQNWDIATGDYWMAQAIDPESVLAFQGLIRIYSNLKDNESLDHCFNIIENYPKLKKQLIGEMEE